MNHNTDSSHPAITYTNIYYLLKKLSEDQIVENSHYRNLYLVRECKKNNPLFSNSQAIRRVFTDVLNVLNQGTEKQKQYAYILKGRFWEKFSITKMTTSDRPDQISSRTFSNEQKKAINAFCEVLTLLEQQCIKDHPELEISDDTRVKSQSGSITESTDQNLESRINWQSKNRAIFAIAGLVLVITLIAWSIIPRTMTTQNTTANSPVGETAASESEISPTKMDSAPMVMGSYCQEKESFPVTVTEDQFMRSQGVVIFDKDTTPGIINNKVRSVLADSKGIWIGYFATEQNPSSGISYFDKEHKKFYNCSQTGITEGQNINDIVKDNNNVLWIGMEKGGIASFNGKTWRLFTTKDGLPSDWIYGLFVDEENFIWAATFKGVAKFDGSKWNTVFNVENGSLINDRTHVITVDESRNIWIGYIDKGLSVFHQSTGKWEHFSKDPNGLSGNQVRDISIQTIGETDAPIVWIATFDNGISRYQNDNWTSFTVEDGLPGNEIRDIALDKYGRVWAATSKGVAYFADDKWKPYDTVDTFRLSFGIDCENKNEYCVDAENIWTGTNLLGITQSRLPLTNKGLDVLKVCFVNESKENICPDLITDSALNTVIANYPYPVKSGEKLFLKVSVSPYKPNQLLDSRGDMLVNIDADESMLFGAWKHIAVTGSIESGQEFTFIDYDNPFTAPGLDGEKSKTFFSDWRVWMHTRMIGPTIRISFTVKSDS